MSRTIHDKIMAEAEAKEIVLELALVSATAKKLQDQLRNYVKEFGELVVNGQVWGYSDSVSWEFTAEQMEILFENFAVEGINPYDMVSITNKKFTGVGYTDQDILAFGAKKKITSRFGPRTHHED